MAEKKSPFHPVREKPPPKNSFVQAREGNSPGADEGSLPGDRRYCLPTGRVRPDRPWLVGLILSLILVFLIVDFIILNHSATLMNEWIRQFYILTSILAILSTLFILVKNRKVRYVFLCLILTLASILSVPFQGVISIRMFLLLLVLFAGSVCGSTPAVFVSLVFFVATAALFQGVDMAWPVYAAEATWGDLLLLSLVGIIVTALLAAWLNGSKRTERLISDLKRTKTSVAELSAANFGYSSFVQVAQAQAALEERNRITREIHDGVGYTLTNIMMLSETAIDQCAPDQKRLIESIETIRIQAKTGLYDTRRALHLLRSTGEDLPRGIDAIRHMLDIYQRATGIEARMEMLVRNQIVEDETIFLTVYRFIQEALTNAFQHGQATEVIVRLQKNSEWLIVSVHDNGSGLTTVTEGIGLQGMRERIDFLGGDISYESNIGFTVIARIPIRVDQHED